jgi:malonate-semialdehyde dehydrogenase (acetylating)/methylmalonate-semialdehyde dehydrogenase
MSMTGLFGVVLMWTDTNFYGKGGLNFFTQLKTVTSLWKHEDAIATKASVNMPTHH